MGNGWREKVTPDVNQFWPTFQDDTDPGGPSTCPKCGQVYTGPSSLKRHLWRIHRLASDKESEKTKPQEAQVSDDNDTAKDDKDPEESSRGESWEEPMGELPPGSSDVRPLLAVSLSSGAPRVRSLFSLPPEPAGMQQAIYGAVAGPFKPLLPLNLPGGGAAAGQGGLLPTPPGPSGMPPTGFHPSHVENPFQPPHHAMPAVPMEAPPSLESVGTGSKVQPLMSVGVNSDFPPQGIQPLMSLPVPGVTPYPFAGVMGGGFVGSHSLIGDSPNRHNLRGRRKDRRAKPFQAKDTAVSQAGESAGCEDVTDVSSADHQEVLMIDDDDDQKNQDENVEDKDDVHNSGEYDVEFGESTELDDHEDELGHANSTIEIGFDSDSPTQ